MKTIKLRVEKSYFRNGRSPVIEYYIDGDRCYERSFLLSRAITGTDSESGGGIFTKMTSDIYFYRKSDLSSIFVCVNFDYFDFSDYSHSASEIMAEIKKRAKTINDAFDRKYPVAIEACEETFEIH